MIRRISEQDTNDPKWRADVEELAKGFFNEARLPGKFAPERFFAYWRAYLRTGVGVMFASYHQEAVSGVIGGIITQSAVTGDIILSEAFWFVGYGYRSGGGNGGDGIRLLKAFMDAAKDLKVDHVTMAHLELGNVGHIYERFGFKKLETHYIISL